jgi:hypothetical protein
MKISRPPSGSQPVVPGSPSEVKPGKGRDFAARLDKTAGSRQAATQPEVGRTGHAAKVGGISDVSADLRAGRISPQVAIDRVVERVLERQLGANAPAAVREKLGVALRQTLEDDPVLAAKVRSLGG